MDAKTIAELSVKLLATQLAQIRVWRTDDVDVEKLVTYCVDLAASVVIKSNDHARRFGK